MIINKTLQENYQTVSTNRFIVDSQRFWRKEFHPRFFVAFDVSDFIDTVNAVFSNANNLPIVDYLKTNNFAVRLYNLFAYERYILIPSKNKSITLYSPILTSYLMEYKMPFLSDLYLSLSDLYPKLNMKYSTINQDDFNVTSNRAETGKVDTTKLSVGDTAKSSSNSQNNLDILTQGNLEQTSQSTVENVDSDTEKNTKQINDVFLSPQNQGVNPTNTNTKGQGVAGVTMQGNPSFTTNTTNSNLGDSTIQQTNTSTSSGQAVEGITQNNNNNNLVGTGNEITGSQNAENSNIKNDLYIETLDNDKAKKLQEFYNIAMEDLLKQLVSRLNKWVLRMDIATGDNNYLECETFE